MSTLEKFLKTVREIGKVLMALSVVGIGGFLVMPALGVAKFKNHAMPAVIILAVLFFVALEARSVAGKFLAARERRHSKIMEKAEALAKQGKYAEAAEVYTRQALKELQGNVLFFALYSKYAFEIWIKAGEPRKALNEAANVLWVYVKNDGKWLKYNSRDGFENMASLVSAFFGAGYIAEGAFLAGEVNKELERLGLPMRCAAAPVRKNIFPTSCSDCGANLFSNPYQDIARCEYCKAVFYPLNHSPELKERK